MEPVIFFDGYCGLCNGFVDFIIAVDKKEKFRFSPLQSEYAKKNLPSSFTQDVKSVVVQIDGKTYQKSEAVLAVMEELGGVWKLTSAFGILPLPIMNKAYDLVAANRYKMFGKKDTCRLPGPQERLRFIL